MKKIQYILVGLLLVVGSLQAQTKKTLGFRTGTNYSKITHANLDAKFRAYFSLIYNVKISELYSLQPELGYSGQGGASKNSLFKDVNTDYFTIGATNMFFVKNTGLHFIISPNINFDVDDTLIGLVNREEGNDITFIDFSLGTGLGFDFKNGLAIEIRYNQGLVDVFSGNWHSFDSQQLEDEVQFNSVFQFGASYKFDLSKKDK